MSNKRLIEFYHRIASSTLLEVKALITAAYDISQDCYPSNILLELAKQKVRTAFKKIEKCRKLSHS